jgi:hypothetical protein
MLLSNHFFNLRQAKLATFEIGVEDLLNRAWMEVNVVKLSYLFFCHVFNQPVFEPFQFFKPFFSPNNLLYLMSI